MDVEEWEIVPDDGFLELHDDGGNKIFSRKYICDNNTVFHNYFICPTPDSTQFVDSTTIQFQLDQKTRADDEEEVSKEVVTSSQVVPFEINMLPSTICSKIKAPATEQVVSQVFFKNNTETRLNSQDMKVLLESPKSSGKPQIDDAAPEDNSKGGLNLLSGIGAICSFGVAAAAISIIFIANPRRHMLRLHFFSHHKRMKQMVEQASKLNEAISARRGVPITRAHITVGGHYDALYTNVQ